MGWIYSLFVVAIALQLTNGHPGSHRFRSHKRTFDRPCEDIATAVGEILPKLNALLPPGVSDLIHEGVSEFIVGFDPYTQAGREIAFCSFEGLETLSELVSVAQDLELDFTLIRLAYNYMEYSLHMAQQRLERNLDNNNNYGYSYEPDVAYIRRMTNQLQLIKDLQAFGILDLDPQGHALAEEISEVIRGNSYYYSDFDLEHEPLSNLPTQAQCSQLTNDLRKVWNDDIKHDSRWNPDASEQRRAAIKLWTGIELTDHESIKSDVCNFVEAAHSSEGLFAVSNVIREMEILQHALKAAYPHIQEGFQYALQSVAYITGDQQYPSYPYDIDKRDVSDNGDLSNDVEIQYPEYPIDPPYPYYYGGPNSGPPPEYVEVFEQLAIILSKVQEMGILDLEDDLFTETRRHLHH